MAIAIGELVDDAVVGVENTFRRLRQNRALAQPRPALGVIADATVEVRSGIFYATLIVLLVFFPLFSLPGIEDHLFVGIADDRQPLGLEGHLLDLAEVDQRL